MLPKALKGLNILYSAPAELYFALSVFTPGFTGGYSSLALAEPDISLSYG
jgi:hypothetical protein